MVAHILLMVSRQAMTSLAALQLILLHDFRCSLVARKQRAATVQSMC